MPLTIQKYFTLNDFLESRFTVKFVQMFCLAVGVWCSCVLKTLHYFLLLLHTLLIHEHVCMSECMHVLNNAKSESVSQSIFFIRTKSVSLTHKQAE